MELYFQGNLRRRRLCAPDSRNFGDILVKVGRTLRPNRIQVCIVDVNLRRFEGRNNQSIHLLIDLINLLSYGENL